MNITEARSRLELGDNPSLEDVKKSWRTVICIILVPITLLLVLWLLTAIIFA